MKNWLFPAVLSTVSVGFFASTAQGFTYTFSTSQPCTFGCTGNIDVMGTIETDGTLGAITTANIVDWELVFNSPNYSNSILSPSNGEIIANGSLNLIATETEITFELLGSSDFDGSDLSFSSTVGFPFNLSYSFQGGDINPSQLFITNAPRSDFSDPSDESSTTIFDGEGGTVVLATREAAVESVPEPSTILGLGVVTAMGLGSSLKRKLGKKKAA
ncbi:MAG: PEP-CTERM sorting domain-containing protein [Crocosphaera sp.]|nr:PEP-CTERM sorting domain-containing protein [Crocosphaera sp.]